MKSFRDIKSLNESVKQTLRGEILPEAKAGTIDPEAYYAVVRDGGKTKVVGPYSSEAVATDYHAGDIIDVLDGGELKRSRYKGIEVIKEGADTGLMTDLHNSRGPAVVDSKGRVVAVYRTERAAREHAKTGKPVKEKPVAEAAEPKAPGKPETMAQKHGRMYPRGFKKRKEWLDYAREVLADWKSGDMALSRMESVMGDFKHIGYPTSSYYYENVKEPFDPEYIDAVAKAFTKSMKSVERIGRLGKGSGFNPAMGKVTPNEITAYFQAVIDFCTGEWAAIEKKFGIK